MANEVKLKLAIEGGKVVGAELDGVATKLGTLDNKARAAASGSDTLGTALKGLITVGAAMALVRMADSVTTLHTQLRLSSNSAAEAGKAYGALFDIAQKGRVSFTELGTTYAAVARSGRELGVSQDRLLNVTKSISQAMTIGGGSASSMQAALVQLGQGLSSGVLRGEELNSIMEQTPRLAKAIADGLGVPIGKLREMGAAGELTSQQVIAALEKAGPQLAKEMASATLTVGQAMTMLSNSAVKMVGDADAASGASATLAGALKGVSGAIDTVGSAINNNQTAFAALSGGLGGVAAVAGLAAVAANIGKIRTAVLALNVALVSNPATAILLGLGMVVGAAYSAADATSKTLDGMKAKLKDLQASDGVGMYGTKASDTAIKNRLEDIARLQQSIAELEASTSTAYSAEDERLSRHTVAYKNNLTARAAFEKEGEAYLGKAQKNQATLNAEIDKNRTLLDSGTISATEYAQRINAVQASFAKATPSVKGLSDAQKEASKAAEDLRKSYTAQAQTLGDARNKEYDDIEKYMAAQNLSVIEAGNAADASVRAAQLELDQRGMLKSAIAETTAARLTEQLATKTAGTAAYDSLVRQIEAQKKLAGIYRQGEALDAVDDLAKENKKAAEESSKYWEDALMRAFESGKGFFQSLWDTIKNTMKTQVLKVFVSATGLTGMTAATAGQAGGFGDAGGIMNLAGMGSNVSALWGGINTASGAISTGAVNAGKALFNLGLNDAGQAMNEVGNMAIKYADTINLVGNSLSYLSAANSLANGQYGAAAGQAIGTWFGGPIGGAIGNAIGGAVDSMFGGGGGPKVSSAYNTAGVYDSDTSPNRVAAVYGRSVEDAWTSIAKQLSLTSKLTVSDFVSADPHGTAQTQFYVGADVNGQRVYGAGGENAGRTTEDLQAAMAEQTTRILFAALKASDLPAQYKTYLATVGSSVSEMTVAMSNVAVIHDFTSALSALPFANLKALSFDAAMGLITVAGGLDNLQANLGTYYTNFYTAEEQRAQTIKAINSATAGSGLNAATATKETFRAIVEAQDLTTASGQQMYATLLGVSGQFATLADAAEASADMVKSAFQSAADSMVSEIQRIRGVSAGDSAMGMAQAQSAFTIASAQARAGDQSAASQLPELSQALLSLAETNAVTLADLQRIRGLTAASLTDTSSALGSTYGLRLPSFDVGTNYVPHDMIAMIHEGEEITPRAYNPAAGGSRVGNADVVVELQRLRQDNANMRTELQAIALHAAKTAKILARVTQNGESVLTTAT